MGRFHVFAVIALAAALAFPAAAGAAARAAGPPAAKATVVLSAAADVGLRYWGAAPCGGQVELVARSPLAAGLDPRSQAWATFGSALGANNLAAPASSYTDCAIAFARKRWPSAASMRRDWNMLCTTMIHEQGHLLGHAHDLAPRSVMAPIFTDRSSVPSICRASRPRPAK